MKTLSALALAVYYCMTVVYYAQFFLTKNAQGRPERRRANLRAWISGLITSVLAVALTLLLQRVFNGMLAVTLCTLVLTAGMRCAAPMSRMQAWFGGSVLVLMAYYARGTAMLLSVLLVRGWINLPVSEITLFYASALVALPPLTAVQGMITHRLASGMRARRFFDHMRTLRLALFVEAVTIINLELLNVGRVMIPPSPWYAAVSILSSDLAAVMLVFAIIHASRSNRLGREKTRASLSEDQFKRQMRHYQAYQKYVAGYRAFRHDYAAMMSTLRTLLRQQKSKEALDLLDELYSQLQKNALTHKKYSDSIPLDALLQDYANLCEENRIVYTFAVPSLENTRLSLLQSVQLLSNLLSNAIDACLKIPPDKRFIRAQGIVGQDWISLQITNPYDGRIRESRGRLLTTKADEEEHGFGFSIVRDTAEQAGGVVTYQADRSGLVFNVSVHLPMVPPQETPQAGIK